MCSILRLLPEEIKEAGLINKHVQRPDEDSGAMVEWEIVGYGHTRLRGTFFLLKRKPEDPDEQEEELSYQEVMD